MKKLFLLPVLALLLSCSPSKSTNTMTTVEEKTITNSFKDNIPPTFYLTEYTSQYSLTYHEILDTVYEKCVDSYLRNELKRNQKTYYVKSLDQDQDFLSKVKKAKESNSYVKISFPKTKRADDFTFDTTDRFEDFNDAVSVYHGDVLNEMINIPNIKRIVITKGKEHVKPAQGKEFPKEGDYVEALFAVELSNGTYKYYNLSHIPPGEILKK